MVDVVVVADTHLRSGLGNLPAPLVDALGSCDAVLHAGDVVSLAALEELRHLATMHAVLGNNDHELAGLLPDELEIELGGVRLAMLHDSGASAGRAARLARRYPAAQLVVFGHSHIPLDLEGMDGQRLFNPGSPTQRRAQPHATFGRLRLEGGRIVAHSIHRLPGPVHRLPGPVQPLPEPVRSPPRTAPPGVE
ncbi:MAG TPA: metallophosphoesterase family protein [Acidimicrobiales bacterium]|nr:metallophosphoesterase family protein [Acidimicrobiales bacterium]